MRSYQQYCGLARALDVVGDRWTLLIVRELLLVESARYSDLLAGLPGIATNLLGERLRAMEDAGLVAREESPPPRPATLFRLTARGAALEPVLEAFGRWAAPLMGEPHPDDTTRPAWLLLPMRLYLKDRTPSKPPATIQVIVDGVPLLIETTGGGSVRTRAGTVERPDATLSGAPHVVMGVLVGRLSVAQGRARGLRFHGDAKALLRLQPPAGS